MTPDTGRPVDPAAADRQQDAVAHAADAVAAAVRAVPGVVDLHGGVLGEVATYLPGRRVNGVRLTDGGVDLHLVVSTDRPLADTVASVRTALRALVDGAVDITVEDVAP